MEIGSTMIDLNIYWQLFDTVFKQRKGWYISEPKPRTETVHQELIRRYDKPGALIPYQKGWSPYSILLEQINKQKEDDLKYVDENLTKGLFYGTNWEKESQEADIQAEKAFEEAKEDDRSTFKGASRLESLYGTMPEDQEWRHWKIIRTPYRVDSIDKDS